MARPEIERRLGVKFRDLGLLQTALTHRSVLNELPEGEVEHNERLEFLGDAVLGAVVADELYRAFPQATEGSLTTMRAELVRRSGLAAWARHFELGQYVSLGRGEEAHGGRERDALLASAFEALMAALYLDRGYSAVRNVVGPLVEAALPDLLPSPRSRDAKSELQYQSQARSGVLPAYHVVKVEGPEHQPQFTVEVAAGELVRATGSGPSKREAEQAAAHAALMQLESPTPDADG
jgi:ribonuclease III